MVSFPEGSGNPGVGASVDSRPCFRRDKLKTAEKTGLLLGSFIWLNLYKSSLLHSTFGCFFCVIFSCRITSLKWLSNSFDLTSVDCLYLERRSSHWASAPNAVLANPIDFMAFVTLKKISWILHYTRWNMVSDIFFWYRANFNITSGATRKDPICP